MLELSNSMLLSVTLFAHTTLSGLNFQFNCSALLTGAPILNGFYREEIK